eukprot:scaffold62291_cov57-Phaeocystis_antarctica.AAC.1
MAATLSVRSAAAWCCCATVELSHGASDASPPVLGPPKEMPPPPSASSCGIGVGGGCAAGADPLRADTAPPLLTRLRVCRSCAGNAAAADDAGPPVRAAALSTSHRLCPCSASHMAAPSCAPSETPSTAAAASASPLPSAGSLVGGTSVAMAPSGCSFSAGCCSRSVPAPPLLRSPCRSSLRTGVLPVFSAAWWGAWGGQKGRCEAGDALFVVSLDGRRLCPDGRCGNGPRAVRGVYMVHGQLRGASVRPM